MPRVSLVRTAKRVALIAVGIALVLLFILNYDAIAEHFDRLIAEGKKQSKGGK